MAYEQRTFQESQWVEYKLKLTKELDLEKEVITFLNSKTGGAIYFGIDDSRR